MALEQDIWNGTGYWRGNQVVEITEQFQELQLQGPGWIKWDLPKVDFLAMQDNSVRQAIVNAVLEEDRDRFENFFSQVHLGLAPVVAVSCGPAESVSFQLSNLIMLTN